MSAVQQLHSHNTLTSDWITSKNTNNGSRGVSVILCCYKPLTSVSIYRRIRTDWHSDPLASLFHIQQYCDVWKHELEAFVMNLMAEEKAGYLTSLLVTQNTHTHTHTHTQNYGSSHNLSDIRMRRRRFPWLFTGSVGLVVLITTCSRSLWRINLSLGWTVLLFGWRKNDTQSI